MMFSAKGQGSFHQLAGGAITGVRPAKRGIWSCKAMPGKDAPVHVGADMWAKEGVLLKLVSRQITAPPAAY